MFLSSSLGTSDSFCIPHSTKLREGQDKANIHSTNPQSIQNRFRVYTRNCVEDGVSWAKLDSKNKQADVTADHSLCKLQSNTDNATAYKNQVIFSDIISSDYEMRTQCCGKIGGDRCMDACARGRCCGTGGIGRAIRQRGRVLTSVA